MLNKEKVNEILAIISSSVVQLDDQNLCVLGVNEEIAIHLQFDPETGFVDVVTDIGDLSETVTEVKLAIISELMSANFMWDQTVGRTLALSPNRTTVVCQERYVDSDDRDLSSFLVEFAEFAEFIKQRYVALENAANEEYEKSIEDDIPDIDVEDDSDGKDDNELKNNIDSNIQIFNV